MLDERQERRAREDAAFIETPDDWPTWPLLHLKTQPWVEPQAFGYIRADHPLRVVRKDSNGVEDFTDTRSIVERWSVD